jgi:hypothetical protein
MWQGRSVALPRLTRLVVLTLLLFSSPRAVSAAHYTFTKIADNSAFNAPSINNDGTVTFSANGIFTGSGGAITTIAAGGGSFSSIPDQTPSINDIGTVAFSAELASGVKGIFTGSGGVITPIADTNGPFSGFFGFPTINNDGTVAFYAGLDAGGSGIFTSSGGPITTIVTSGPNNLSAFPSIDSNGTVAFTAGNIGSIAGIFAGDGGALTPIVTQAGPFSSFGAVTSVNNDGTVAFYAELDAGGSGIFTSDGTLTTTIADTSDPFSSFGAPSINNLGAVAFPADLNAGGRGIFTGPDPVADKVIAVGDSLLGSTITGIAGSFSTKGLNDSGQIVFIAFLADGTTGIFRANPVPLVLAVNIDIGPHGEANRINPKSHGEIQLAILSTASFSATTVNASTVRFGKTGTETAPEYFALKDVNSDSAIDMLLRFNIQDTGIQCGDTRAVLTGKTLSGQVIEGSDSIQTVGCK